MYSGPVRTFIELDSLVERIETVDGMNPTSDGDDWKGIGCVEAVVA
jgi:hypothetical protein